MVSVEKTPLPYLVFLVSKVYFMLYYFIGLGNHASSLNGIKGHPN